MFLHQLPAVHGSFHFNETVRNSLHRRKMSETNVQRFPRLGPYKYLLFLNFIPVIVVKPLSAKVFPQSYKLASQIHFNRFVCFNIFFFI